MSDKAKVKLILYLLVTILFGITFTIFANTFALFEDNANGTTNMDIGNWVIKLNDITITNGTVQNLVVNSFVYDTNATVTNGTIAPGMSAYFDLILDATECEVAVKYDIKFKFDQMTYADNITFSVSEVGGSQTVLTDEHTYSGIISLQSILDDTLVRLRVYVNWNNNESYNANDTKLGTEENSTLSVPIEVHAVQYLGETLTPYNGTSGS